MSQAGRVHASGTHEQRTKRHGINANGGGQRPTATEKATGRQGSREPPAPARQAPLAEPEVRICPRARGVAGQKGQLVTVYSITAAHAGIT